MTAYYSENDPYAAQWLRNLITENLIAPGVVDERSILDVDGDELREFTQCHFFAGIGIWSGALRSIGWPDDKPIWTGSCPCQPFSNAGKQKGFQDERHLWPVWKELIAKFNPPRVVGEQVASKAGRIWLDTVSADLEALGFAFGASDLCAAGFGGAHLRQRLYFVATASSNCADGLGNLAGERRGEKRRHSPRSKERNTGASETSGLADDDDDARSQGWAGMPERAGECVDGANRMASRLADSDQQGSSGRRIQGSGEGGGASLRPIIERPEGLGSNSGISARTILHSRQARSLDDVDWLLCRNPAGEPSWRPVESGTFPLAHGVSGRVGKLRAYGNALDFETAASFCAAVADIEGL